MYVQAKYVDNAGTYRLLTQPSNPAAWSWIHAICVWSAHPIAYVGGPARVLYKLDRKRERETKIQNNLFPETGTQNRKPLRRSENPARETRTSMPTDSEPRPLAC